jgi:ClpP class serine protease
VGSIGVISGGFGFTELIKKIGVERRIFTAGDNKSFLDPFEKVNKKDETKLKNLQKQIHQNFIDWVTSRRKRKINEKDTKVVFSGSFWLSSQAKDLGLIDGISSESNFFKLKFGEKTKIKKIKQPKSFKQKLGLGISTLNSDDLLLKLKEELLLNKFGL